MRRSWLMLVMTSFLAGFDTPAVAASDRAVSVSAGLGLAVPSRQNGQNVPGTGEGGFAQIEYIFRSIDWATPRLYAGGLLTAAQSDCGPGVVPCDVSANIFFAGGKLRLMAPIPYVGPFIEAGIGASAGKLSTRSGQVVDLTGSGVMLHVPLAIGLALGDRHQFEVGFWYLVHPAQKLICGAAAVGLTFDFH